MNALITIILSATIYYCPVCDKPYPELNLKYPVHSNHFSFHNNLFHKDTSIIPREEIVPDKTVINGIKYQEGIMVDSFSEDKSAISDELEIMLWFGGILIAFASLFFGILYQEQYRIVNNNFGNKMSKTKKAFLAGASLIFGAYVGIKIARSLRGKLLP